MKPFQSYRVLLGLSLMIVLLMGHGLLRPVLASGPGTGGSKIRISDEKIGPYTLLVATSPLPVTVGQMSVWVRVSDSQTGQFRRDAVVRIEATPRGGGSTISTEATHQNAGNNSDYVAHLKIEDTGDWDVTIYVEDELGSVNVSFTETVTQARNVSLLIGLTIPFLILAVVVGIYLWRRSATPK